MTNVSPWIIRIVTLPQFASLFGTVHCPFSHRELVQISPVHPNPMIWYTITHKPPYIFLKTATIPTYHGISIAIPRYIAMQLSPFHFYDTHRHCHIALHDHIADIVFVAQPPFIIFIHVTLASLHILVHCQRHSYRVIFCSKYRDVILEL